MALHEILTNKRIELGISIDEIVKRCGVPKGTVAKIMAGITPNPQIESLKAIAYALGLTLDDLDETPKKAAFSAEAMKLAQIYDSLDSHSQRVVYTVAMMESKRGSEPALPKGVTPIGAMPMYRIPYLGDAMCDGSIETKQAAKRELAELESSTDKTPVE